MKAISDATQKKFKGTQGGMTVAIRRK